MLEKIAKKYMASGFSEALSYAKAYRDVWESRKLEVFDPYSPDNGLAKMPISYDETALSYIRPDQTPRFLGALTHPEINPVKSFSLWDVVAIQNRVDSKKVKELAKLLKEDEVCGIIGRFCGKNYILDGHHRIIARWLQGAETINCYFIDLSEYSNTMKSKDSAFTLNQKVCKMDTDKRLVYGWASVVEYDGKPLVDYHGDTISVEELVKAAHDFMISSRAAKAMHEGRQVGEFVESVVFTEEVQKALNIDLGLVGWWVVMKVYDEEIWQKVKSGELNMFSIGGQAQRVIDNG